uniref:Uncharacterized protein n=1 Tax=Anguilla anguilla TaxID=7936 RepID=A0A0E9T973_ANGAN
MNLSTPIAQKSPGPGMALPRMFSKLRRCCLPHPV